MTGRGKKYISGAPPALVYINNKENVNVPTGKVHTHFAKQDKVALSD